ncbi:hypothetical protein IGI37_001392 [Enterococcus sp. AZ194]|uniref:hypothetical protein n=1 Tax=Enterococcus sp. AZ194 TaxID=2774629 RepID=UPI003F2011A9
MKKETGHLTRNSKNIKQTKQLLRREIASTTDSETKIELTKMLIKIERDEKNRFMRWALLIGLLLIASIGFLYFLGDNLENEPTQKAMGTSNTSTGQTKNSQPVSAAETTESRPLETSLSEEQLKEWVLSVLQLIPEPTTHYTFDVYVEKSDQLAYITVNVDQLGNLGLFRVNAQGELEASGRITLSSNDSEWVVLSKKYLDTSIAADYFGERQHNLSKLTDQTEIAKKLLIGNTYTIVPTLYDNVDAAKAMDESLAPQNLLHDGIQTITFVDDTTVFVELAGTYRPNHNKSYTLSADTFYYNNYSIPYSINNGQITFDSWTTSLSGHTVTWSMAISKH